MIIYAQYQTHFKTTKKSEYKQQSIMSPLFNKWKVRFMSTQRSLIHWGKKYLQELSLSYDFSYFLRTMEKLCGLSWDPFKSLHDIFRFKTCSFLPTTLPINREWLHLAVLRMFSLHVTHLLHRQAMSRGEVSFTSLSETTISVRRREGGGGMK